MSNILITNVHATHHLLTITKYFWIIHCPTLNILEKRNFSDQSGAILPASKKTTENNISKTNKIHTKCEGYIIHKRNIMTSINMMIYYPIFLDFNALFSVFFV